MQETPQDRCDSADAHTSYSISLPCTMRATGGVYTGALRGRVYHTDITLNPRISFLLHGDRRPHYPRILLTRGIRHPLCSRAVPDWSTFGPIPRNCGERLMSTTVG